MVVGPDFGPIAGVCVALVNRNRTLVRRSGTALLYGFLVGIAASYLATLLLKGVDQLPDRIAFDSQVLVRFISNPDFFSVYVALIAGVVGMLSLTTAKSSALVGVLISITTIPAAANIGVAAAYTDWATAWGATVQLGLNLISIFVAGLLTLLLQRRLYMSRRRRHLNDPSRRPRRPADRLEPPRRDRPGPGTRARVAAVAWPCRAGALSHGAPAPACGVWSHMRPRCQPTSTLQSPDLASPPARSRQPLPAPGARVRRHHAPIARACAAAATFTRSIAASTRSATQSSAKRGVGSPPSSPAGRARFSAMGPPVSSTGIVPRRERSALHVSLAARSDRRPDRHRHAPPPFA